MSRPKYTPELAARIAGAIENRGCTLPAAALLSGISDRTALEWQKKKPEFAEAIARAEAAYKTAHLQAIGESCNTKGDHDWRASAWLLEHRFREEFGSTKAEAKAADGPALTLTETERQKIIARRKAALESSHVANP